MERWAVLVFVHRWRGRKFGGMGAGKEVDSSFGGAQVERDSR